MYVCMYLFIYLFLEKGRESVNWGEGQRETEGENLKLSITSIKPEVGLDLLTLTS